MTKAKELKKENYTLQVKYSDDAIKNKLIKFISKSGDEFEISAEEIVSFLVNIVNLDSLSATMVDTEKIDVVEVSRQVKCVLDRDFKQGEEIRLTYIHPYPLEFAIIEESYKLAQIDPKVKVFELTNKFLEEAKKKILPEQENYIKKFYSSFKEFDINKIKSPDSGKAIK